MEHHVGQQQKKSGHHIGKKKTRYLIKGMTRDEYNDKVEELLCHRKRLKTK